MTQMTSGYPFGLEVDAPAAQNRLSVLLRIFYIIPHMIVLYILGIVAAIIYFISWFAILFTGGYPSGMMNFMLNYLHWSTRANAYLYLLTGQYPPFSMGPDGAYPVRLAAMGQLEGRNRLTTFWPIRSILAIPHIIVLYILSIVAGIVLFFTKDQNGLQRAISMLVVSCPCALIMATPTAIRLGWLTQALMVVEVQVPPA